MDRIALRVGFIVEPNKVSPVGTAYYDAEHGVTLDGFPQFDRAVWERHGVTVNPRTRAFFADGALFLHALAWSYHQSGRIRVEPQGFEIMDLNALTRALESRS